MITTPQGRRIYPVPDDPLFPYSLRACVETFSVSWRRARDGRLSSCARATEQAAQEMARHAHVTGAVGIKIVRRWVEGSRG